MILKTETAKMLERIGDKVGGCMKYVLNRAIKSLKVQLGLQILESA
jgi:hypothetical protein